QGEAILVGVNRHGADAQLVGGAEDANGDFTAVGGEQLFDHAGRRSQHGGSSCFLGHHREFLANRVMAWQGKGSTGVSYSGTEATETPRLPGNEFVVYHGSIGFTTEFGSDDG